MKKRWKLAAIASFAVAITAAVLVVGSLRRPARAESQCPVPLTKGGVCQLHGKVKFVTSFPKYKIKITNSFPDIKVKRVSSFPDKPGEWQIVDSFPDFTVQIVDSFPDFTVQYVDSFPGC